MVAALEIHIGLLGQLVVDQNIEALALTQWRDGAVRAIGEELIKLVLACERAILAQSSL